MSNVEPLISFEEMNHLLIPLGALNSPAELHGMLCGKLSGGQRLPANEWLAQALIFMDIITSEEEGVVGDPEGRGQAAMARLYPVTLAQLQDDQLGFQLLLPSDEVDLERRSQALGEWCHGFLTGFGSAGLAAGTKFSEESADCLRDLAAIAQIGDGAEEDEGEAESHLAQIEEYVRMAVLTLFMEFGNRPAGDTDQPLLH